VRLVLWDEARRRLISFRELQTDHRACAHVPFSTSSTP
jgi:hypothetical protein